ncbi:uncharacterized protein [Hetaerina americana]|uniref:uncharacterized protein n=1 Tax=Hetaerina americana TaxID=62018 RepID=UPI003A7F1D25
MQETRSAFSCPKKNTQPALSVNLDDCSIPTSLPAHSRYGSSWISMSPSRASRRTPGWNEAGPAISARVIDQAKGQEPTQLDPPGMERMKHSWHPGHRHWPPIDREDHHGENFTDLTCGSHWISSTMTLLVLWGS